MLESDLEIPAEPVEKYFTMNPDEDDVLVNGTHLQNGMIVLLESPAGRKPRADLSPESGYEELKYNRWCRVTDLETSRSGESVVFVGVYADGVKMVRSHPRYRASWLVKKSSIPATPVQTEQLPIASRFGLDKLGDEPSPFEHVKEIRNIPQPFMVDKDLLKDKAEPNREY